MWKKINNGTFILLLGYCYIHFPIGTAAFITALFCPTTRRAENSFMNAMETLNWILCKMGYEIDPDSNIALDTQLRDFVRSMRVFWFDPASQQEIFRTSQID